MVKYSTKKDKNNYKNPPFFDKCLQKNMLYLKKGGDIYEYD